MTTDHKPACGEAHLAETYARYMTAEVPHMENKVPPYDQPQQRIKWFKKTLLEFAAALTADRPERGGYFLDKSHLNELQIASIEKAIAHSKRGKDTDIYVRKDGSETHYEGDWIKHLALTEHPTTSEAMPGLQEAVEKGRDEYGHEYGQIYLRITKEDYEIILQAARAHAKQAGGGQKYDGPLKLDGITVLPEANQQAAGDVEPWTIVDEMLSFVEASRALKVEWPYRDDVEAKLKQWKAHRPLAGTEVEKLKRDVYDLTVKQYPLFTYGEIIDYAVDQTIGMLRGKE